MSTSTSRPRKHWALAWALPLGCTVAPLDAPALDTDGPVTSTGDTGDDVSTTSSTDDGGSSSETGGGSGGGSGGETTGPDDFPPEPEAPDDSCLENLPSPDSQDKVWVAAGGDGFILRSTNGMDWDELELGVTADFESSASVGSTFVIEDSEQDVLLVSDDGALTWDVLASGLPTGLHDMAGVGDLFVARDEAGATSYWSEDGRTWHEAQGVALQPVYAVARPASCPARTPI